MATSVASDVDSSVASAERIFERDFNLGFVANFGVFGAAFLLLAALPVYVSAIGGSASDVGLIMAAPSIAAIALRPFSGVLCDRRGCKLLMIVGALVTAVALALYGIASTVPLLAIVRAVHGVGWSIFSTASSAYVARIVRPRRRGEAIGYFGMSSTLPMAVGPALGLWLTGAGGYEILFAAGTSLAFLALVLSAVVRESPVQGGQTSSVHWGSLVLRSALLPSFVVACSGLTYGAIVSFVPLFAEKSGLGNSGLFFIVYATFLLVTRGPLGKLSDTIGRPKVIGPCLILQAAALFVLASTTTTWQLLLAAVLMGTGFAGTQPTLIAYAVDRAGAAERGAAMGTLMLFLDAGIGAGSLTWGFVGESFGFGALFIAAGCASLVGLFLLAFAKGRKTVPA